jgi:hypothetical protein
MTQVHAADQKPEVVNPELIAKTIAGTALIGEAQRALVTAGFPATISGNRITVAECEAHLFAANGCWQVMNRDGTPPIWTVGTSSESSVSSWIGCVE